MPPSHRRDSVIATMLVAILMAAFNVPLNRVSTANAADDLSATVSAQSTQIAELTAEQTANLVRLGELKEQVRALKATVAARGKKINSQRTQIADLQTQVSATDTEILITQTPRPTDTPTDVAVVDPYIIQLNKDLTALLADLDQFAALMQKFAGGNVTSSGVTEFHSHTAYWAQLDEIYAGTIAPSQYTSIHNRWLDDVHALKNAGVLLEGRLQGFGTEADTATAFQAFYIAQSDLADIKSTISRYL